MFYQFMGGPASAAVIQQNRIFLFHHSSYAPKLEVYLGGLLPLLGDLKKGRFFESERPGNQPGWKAANLDVVNPDRLVKTATLHGNPVLSACQLILKADKIRVGL